MLFQDKSSAYAAQRGSFRRKKNNSNMHLLPDLGAALEMFYKNAVFKNFAIFTGKQLESLFNKVADLKDCNFIKKRL